MHKGWNGESARHSAARKGIKTKKIKKTYTQKEIDNINPMYVVDNEFNRTHYPDLIGNLYFIKYPSYVRLKELVHEKKLREHWGSGKPMRYNNTDWDVHKMSYGTYFLEPVGYHTSEKMKFHPKTIWFNEKIEGKYYMGDVE